MHQLLHITQSVVDWGPLWAHSGYCFESGNGHILRKVQAAKGVVSQICRSVAMIQSELILKTHVAQKSYSKITNFVNYLDHRYCKSTVKLSQVRYFGRNRPLSRRWITELQLSNESRVYRKIVKDRCLYTSCRKNRIRSDNSFAITHEKAYVQVVDFIIDAQTRMEYTICKFLITEEIFHNDFLSLKMITNISDRLVAVETNNIDRVCVYINVNNVMYICAVPNLHFY